MKKATTTIRKTRPITKTKKVNFMDEFQLLIDEIVLKTFQRKDLTESLNSTDENDGVSYRPRLFRMIETYSKKINGTFKNLDDVDTVYRQLCELDHLQLDNANCTERMKWTNRWIKKADKTNRQKVPQAVTQMFTDFRSCFKDISKGGLNKVEIITEVKKDGTEDRIEVPENFNIFKEFSTYSDLINALKDSREKAKDSNITELTETNQIAIRFIKKNPEKAKSFLLGFITLCTDLEIPTTKEVKSQSKKAKTITARNKKSKEK